MTAACPKCAHRLTADPKQGDLVLCGGCAQFCRMDAGHLRELNVIELQGVMQTPFMLQAQAQVAMHLS